MRERRTDLAIAAALFASNLLILGPWAFSEYSDQPWNNGYIYIAIARLFHDHKWSWNPQHYGGAPFHYLYPPLFHVIVGAVPFVSIARAFHLVTAIGYALTPVCLYVLARVLFGSRLLAAFAGLAYGAFPSPIYAFLPAWRDIARPYAHAPWSFVDLIAYEEAGHAFALPIMFLAVAAAWRGRWRLAVLLAAAVFLTNWPGLIGFSFALAGILVSRRLTIAKTIGLVGGAYGLSAFWMTPGYFVSSSLLNRIVLRHTLTATAWNATTGMILASAAILVGLSLWPRSRPEHALIWTWLALSGAVVVSYTAVGNYLLPSPHRYMLEFNAACILAVVSLISLAPKKSHGRIVALATVAGLAASFGFLDHPWSFERPSQNPRTSVAWQIADWLNRNAGSARVLASGELDSTLALWSDVPEAGGSGQDVSNFLIWAAERQVAYGCAPDSERAPESEIAELWLRALNVGWLVVHGASSREYFHWYAQPEKFAALPVAWDNGADDKIYTIPIQPEAVVVDVEAIKTLPELRSTADGNFLNAYVKWAAGKRPASIRWNGVDHATIDAALAPGEAVLVRVNNDPGWRAAGASTAADPIGFLLLRGSGSHFELRFGPSGDTWLGRAITALTIILLLAGVSGFRVAAVAILPAFAAYLVLLHSVPATANLAEEAFVRLQPPIINPGGIVGNGTDVVSVYGLNFGAAKDSVHLLLNDREAEILYRSPNLINFRMPKETPAYPALSIEVNGCRGNEFTVPAR